MDIKALNNLSYGVFLVGAKNADKVNACITNTCIQIASDPVRVAISVINKNFTCDMIKSSGTFTVSVLDKTVKFELIKNFGMQSGRDTDKFKDYSYETDKNGNPYITSNVNTLLSCKVLSSQDLGSHTLFIAEVEDAKIMSSEKPVTYADYHATIKPKTSVQTNRKIIGWKCKICGYVYEGETLPAEYLCPLCGHPADDFEPIYEEPKAEREIVGWRCKICGYEYKGSELPEEYKCPVCDRPKEEFEPIYK